MTEQFICVYVSNGVIGDISKHDDFDEAIDLMNVVISYQDIHSPIDDARIFELTDTVTEVYSHNDVMKELRQEYTEEWHADMLSGKIPAIQSAILHIETPYLPAEKKIYSLHDNVGLDVSGSKGVRLEGSLEDVVSQLECDGWVLAKGELPLPRYPVMAHEVARFTRPVDLNKLKTLEESE